MKETFSSSSSLEQITVIDNQSAVSQNHSGVSHNHSSVSQHHPEITQKTDDICVINGCSSHSSQYDADAEHNFLSSVRKAPSHGRKPATH